MTVVPRAISVSIIEFYLENAACLVENQTTRKLEAGKQKSLLIGQLQEILLKDFNVVMDDKQIRTHWQNKKSQIMRKAKEFIDRRAAFTTDGNFMDGGSPAVFDCPTEQRVLDYLMTVERPTFERSPFKESKPSLLFTSRKRSLNIKDEVPEMDFKIPKLEDLLAGTFQSLTDTTSIETPDSSPNKFSQLEAMLAATHSSDGFANSPLKTPLSCPSSPVVDIQSFLTSIMREGLAQNDATSSLPCSTVVDHFSPPSPVVALVASTPTTETSPKEDIMTTQSLHVNSNVLQDFLRSHQTANAKLQDDFANLEEHMPAIDTLIQLQKNALKHQEVYLQAIVGMVSSTTHLVNTMSSRLAKEGTSAVQESSTANGSVDGERSAADRADRIHLKEGYGVSKELVSPLPSLHGRIVPYSPMTNPFSIPSYPLHSPYYVPFGSQTNAYFPPSLFNSLCSQTTANVYDRSFLRPESTVVAETFSGNIDKSFSIPHK